MPELPEVETIRRGLEPKVKKRTVTRVEVRMPKQIQGMASAAFSRKLKNQIIRDVRRRSKFLILGFGAFDVYIHLGMTGQATYWDQSKSDAKGFVRHKVTGLQKTVGQHAPDKHTHVLFHLKGGDRIQYRDIRQFGYIKLLMHEDFSEFQPLNNLGVEPLDKAFTWKAFRLMMQPKKGALKAMLLSQRPVCGLGNIYVDEALHLAGLHPLQRMENLGDKERRALHKAIPKVLNKGLKNGGTSFSDFVGADGVYGRNKESLKVYGRGGEPCLKCGRELSKIQVVQRTTVFCSDCQRKI